MTTFSEELFKLVNIYYNNNNHEVYIHIIAGLIEINHKIDGLKIEDIITCIKRYDIYEDIQENGLYLLGNLTYDNPHNKKQICDKDGINLTFDSMMKFANNQVIQQNGLSLLANLVSDNIYNKKNICYKGGINITFDCIKKFPNNQFIQQNGLLLLGNLASDNSYSRQFIYDNFGIQLVLNATKKYPDNQNIQLHAKKLLDILQTTNKRDREEDGKEPKTSQKVRKLDNGNYITEDGTVLIPSMKALNEAQTAVKVKVEKEEEVAQEDAKSYALFIDKQQSEIDRLKELCKKNNIDV